MSGSRLALLFLAILGAGTAMVVTMVALLVRFHGAIDQSASWRSLVVALAGAGVGLCVTAIVHLSLIVSRRSAAARRAAQVSLWTGAWCAVAAGADVPTVRSTDTDIASEGAALVLQDLRGESAERIRRALFDCGLIDTELSLATRGLASQSVAATEALERLAWIAAPEALPLFEVAAGSGERASRAALLGVMRVLAGQGRPEDVGSSVMLVIEEHVKGTKDPDGARPYLSAALLAAGDNLVWLCRELLVDSEVRECVRAAALDALGRSHRPEAVDIATAVLLSGCHGEVKAASLRTLARVGGVPRPAVAAVVAATNDEFMAVRVHAAHALVGVEPSVALPTLWHGLADSAWEVRRASADTLWHYGRQGEDLLRRAAARHNDKFARDVAAMTLGPLVARDAAGAVERGASDRSGPLQRPDLPLIGDVVVRGHA